MKFLNCRVGTLNLISTRRVGESTKSDISFLRNVMPSNRQTIQELTQEFSLQEVDGSIKRTHIQTPVLLEQSSRILKSREILCKIPRSLNILKHIS